QQFDIRVGDRLCEPLTAKSLGRDVYQLVTALPDSSQAFDSLGLGQRTVYECRRNAARAERVKLVLHQRDELRDDHRNTSDHQGRQLIAQRLTAPRRHHHDRVSTFEHGLYYLALSLSKLVEAKMFLQLFSSLSKNAHPEVPTDLQKPGEVTT